VNDQEIYLKGDQDSFDIIYRHFAPKMFGICLRFAKNHMDAEEILQEGFIKIFTKLGEFRNEGSFEGWIRRTIINTAINYYKKNLRRLMDSDVNDCEIADRSLLDIYCNLSMKELMSLVQDLPTGYRTVFNLNVIEGYTHKEIGEMLNISDNTSKSQLNRAKAILRKKVIAMQREKVKIPFCRMKVTRKKQFVFPSLLKAV
jgi:RNA polymerase sigma-70 factor (ECF subfamily)